MALPPIVVLDDDPTGSQTVHSCLLLTRWDPETLKLGLQDRSPIRFILTNTRALPPAKAAEVTRSVCGALKEVMGELGWERALFVSRSDSTLRGHYPLETDVMAAELGPFDAHFLVPAFFEGGRITRNSVHYLRVGERWIPVHETEFARDAVFGYHHSYLPEYVQEKTQGRIRAEQVVRLTLEQIRAGCLERLLRLEGNVCCVVDGETQADLDRFAQDVWAALEQGKRFLFRSAASLLTALAQLPPQPVPPEEMGQFVRSDRPGVVIVGSHVQKSSQQLARLLQEPGIQGIEVEVKRLLEAGREAELLPALLSQVHRAYGQGLTPVVYTSREEVGFDGANPEARLAFGQRVSRLLMAIVQGLPEGIGYLISKGGITSNDTLSLGLNLPAVRLLGQIYPGISMVLTPADHPRFPNLPVVLFPGNVGEADTLVLIHRRLHSRGLV
ncbi:Hrp-dependent type III effector protein [Synechococcus sp. 60AY4M2]|uniref:four-carbon acid sugar kinase family protein n=1 Tax=unclassified Synechococcus TaxID=2626047 RepID=UPI000C1A50D8|nr:MULTISPECIES: four-carbon acid sugar kinase family protein [unclassified Synechococcus]PIK89352.1 Hrp-dependent type III effector protein [Synechococcus sp. 65AY6A5]PIK95158.1 Hrp-dependent type III effector protein [Synechococcus sp. 60AY4M2]PIL01878.1 Hrp-dependent type III effector protein [Synechococcus sp. 65AY640]